MPKGRCRPGGMNEFASIVTDAAPMTNAVPIVRPEAEAHLPPAGPRGPNVSVLCRAV